MIEIPGKRDSCEEKVELTEVSAVRFGMVFVAVEEFLPGWRNWQTR
jgi:hypothetical protein